MAIARFERRFRRGSPVYTCHLCKRSTRNTGDEESCELCKECFELSSIDNSMNDNYGTDTTNPDGIAAWATYAGEVEKHLKSLAKKGADVARVLNFNEFIRVWRAAGSTGNK